MGLYSSKHEIFSLLSEPKIVSKAKRQRAVLSNNAGFIICRIRAGLSYFSSVCIFLVKSPYFHF